jgi:hypothetical protein
MRAPPKFSRSEVVRITSQSPARARLVGEWGVVDVVEHGLVGPLGYDLDPLDVPEGLATNIYMVNLFRDERLEVGMRNWFNEVDLESRGEFYALFGDEEVQAAARRELARAIACNQLYICSVGYLHCHCQDYTPGIKGFEDVVAGLPKCQWTNNSPDGRPSRVDLLAEAFNREILKHLLERRV